MTNDVTKQTEETPAENNQPIDSVTDETTNSAETTAEATAATATAEAEQSSDEPSLGVEQNSGEQNSDEPSSNEPSSEVELSPNEPSSEAEQSSGQSGEEEQSSNESSEMDFGAILEQFEQEQTAFSKGELVSGKVVGISDRGVLIDFGYKSEGVADIAEFTSPEGEVTVKQGDEVEVTIRAMDSGDSPPILSRMDALRRRAWNEIETAYNQGTPITGRVIDKTKGGLRVDINGVEAFLPGSQVDSRTIRNLDSFRGQEIEAKVIKFSRKRNNIVLSRKVLTDEINSVQKASTLSQVEEGYVVEG